MAQFSNNPQQYIHPIIQAYLSSQQLQQRKVEHEDRQVQEQLDREQRTKQFDDNLKLTERGIKLREDAERADQEFKKFQAIETIRNSILNGGRVPTPNPKVAEMPTEFGTMPDVTTPQNRSYSENVPGVGPVSLENVGLPGDKVNQQVEAFNAMTPGVVDRTGQIASTETEAILPRLALQGQNALELEQARTGGRAALAETQHQNRLDQIDATGKWALTRQNLANAGRVAAQAAKKQAEPGAAENYSTLIGQMASGDATLETLKGMVSIKDGERLAVLNAANAQGIRPITDKQKTFLEGLAVLKQVYDKHQELLEAHKTANPLEIYTKNQEADALLGNIARLLGGEKGVLTQKDVERAKGMRPGFIADKLNPGSNERRQKDFLKFYAETARKVLGGMGNDQRQAIIERWGIIDPNSIEPQKQITKDGHTYLWDGSKYVLSGKAK